MRKIGIQLKRYSYEEPCNLHLVFSASNGRFSGSLGYYCNTDNLKELGMALRSFPKKVPDDYLYEIGSTRPEDNCAYYFALHAYTTDMSGHCALQVVIDNKRDKPYEGECRFSIAAEPLAINRLGGLLLTFSNLKHCSMAWSLSGKSDCLVENENEISK
jgi:hypothetical protein